MRVCLVWERNEPKGETMKTTEMIDGVKVMKLAETHPEETGRDSDALALFKIWSLLSGNDMQLSATVESRLSY